MDRLGIPIDAIVRCSALDPGALGEGTVLSVHRSAVNVIIGARLVTIAASHVGGLPDGALVANGFDPERLGLHGGLSAKAVEGRLRLGEHVSVDLRRARPWSATLVERVPPPARELRARIAAARTALRSLGRDGFDAIPVGEAVKQPIAHVAAAVGSGDVDTIGTVGERLIGLGAGLTPAGDDVLVGLSAALAAVGDPTGRRLARRWATVARAGERTTVVAAAAHRHAADGRYAQRVHHLVAAVLDVPAAAVQSTTVRAARFGSTSGLDTLTGVLLGLALVPSATSALPSERVA